ncbi:MAG TPA: hypothetical protein VN788_17220 [Verrucomicrobiae bacterium]|nr:hypothetical protein [Verrucomicrobiae bacterium]
MPTEIWEPISEKKNRRHAPLGMTNSQHVEAHPLVHPRITPSSRKKPRVVGA